MPEQPEDALAEHAAVLARISELLPAVERVARLLIGTFAAGGRVLTLGNGGSACDAQHLAEVLLAHYRRDRRPLAATALTADGPALTCIANDYAFEDVFSRQVQGLARPGDVVVAFTTSGRSENVVRALAAAKEAGAATVLFTGGEGAPASGHADHVLLVPSGSTARVQEMHVLLLHLLLEPVDAWAAGEDAHT